MATAVLVLNASYEPISHTKLHRAVVMVQNGVAVVEEVVEGRFIRYSAGVLAVPRVLRLVRYVKVAIAHRPAAFSKHGVLVRDRRSCAYCLAPADTVDHIVPRSRGGGNEWLNCVASCRRCNHHKADRTVAQSGMRLRLQPWHPTRSQLAKLAF